jgi:hypothetical protein
MRSITALRISIVSVILAPAASPGSFRDAFDHHVAHFDCDRRPLN